MSDHAGGTSQELGQAYFLDLLGDAYNGLGRYDEAIVALSEAAAAFTQHDAQCAHAVCLFKIAQSHLALAQGEQAIRSARYPDPSLPTQSCPPGGSDCPGRLGPRATGSLKIRYWRRSRRPPGDAGRIGPGSCDRCPTGKG